jgi:RNA polymerase sigma factor FliA
MLGLTQANRAYDDAKGVPFEVYARTRVTGAILDDLRSRDWLTRNQRGKAKIVIEAMRSMQQDNSEITNHASNPRVDEIARRTKLPAAEVNAVLSDLDRAQRMGQTGEVNDPAIAELVRSHDAGPLDEVLDAETVQNVRTAVQMLPSRLRMVIEGVYFGGRQMQVIAEELGVTPSRVSQLCAEALLQLRRSLALLDEDFAYDVGRAS